ncbi:MAG: methyltransferase, partial [Aeromonadaceae bacterium]
MSSSLRSRFAELDGLLTQHASFWQVHPFRLRQHTWHESHPALAACLDGLSLEQLWALDEDQHALVACLQPHIPVAERLAELTRWPLLERPMPPVPEPLARCIPGRKLSQLRH